MNTQHTHDGGESPTWMPAARSAEWWMLLGHAVDDLAQRYPRTYGATIPASWRDDLETAELLANITHWRRELDQQDPPQRAQDGEADDLDAMPFPPSGIERARQQWEWHAHRDQWLARLTETGTSPLHASQFTETT